MKNQIISIFLFLFLGCSINLNSMHNANLSIIDLIDTFIDSQDQSIYNKIINLFYDLDESDKTAVFEYAKNNHMEIPGFESKSTEMDLEDKNVNLKSKPIKETEEDSMDLEESLNFKDSDSSALFYEKILSQKDQIEREVKEMIEELNSFNSDARKFEKENKNLESENESLRKKIVKLQVQIEKANTQIAQSQTQTRESRANMFIAKENKQLAEKIEAL